MRKPYFAVLSAPRPPQLSILTIHEQQHELITPPVHCFWPGIGKIYFI